MSQIPVTIGMRFTSIYSDGLYMVIAGDVDKNITLVKNDKWNVGETQEWCYSALLQGLNNKTYTQSNELFNEKIIIQWISVDDQLPEVSVKGKLNKVLAFSTVIGITTCYYWGIGEKLNDPLKGWCTAGITHWMPLIDTPKTK